MGRLGFLFGVEDETSKDFVVVFVQDKRVQGDVVLGVDYLKIDKSKFFVLNKFNDLDEFLVFDKNKIKFGKIAVSKDKIVSFEDFVFWFRGKEYTEISEKMFIVRMNDRVVLEQELVKRFCLLFKVFERYL